MAHTKLRFERSEQASGLVSIHGFIIHALNTFKKNTFLNNDVNINKTWLQNIAQLAPVIF